VGAERETPVLVEQSIVEGGNFTGRGAERAGADAPETGEASGAGVEAKGAG
jgi:hypothetical protein